MINWVPLLIQHKDTEAPDPWEFLRLICVALDENKIPLPKFISSTSDKSEEVKT